VVRNQVAVAGLVVSAAALRLRLPITERTRTG
jgi:hypothetical protein